MTHSFLILGSGGQLGREFVRELTARNLAFSAPEESQSNITDFKAIEALVADKKPNVILNCAAYNAVDRAETDRDTAFWVNGKAVANLVKIAKEKNIFLVHYSSDYVFDGMKGAPYVEDDRPEPVNVYGKSKLDGELAVCSVLQDYLLFRLSWVFGPGEQNFLFKLKGWAADNPTLRISRDEISVPTYTADVVSLTLASLDKNLKGLYHMTNSGMASRYAWAKFYLEKIGATNEVIAVDMNAFHLAARRPPCSTMSNAKLAQALGVEIPAWQDAVERFVQSYK